MSSNDQMILNSEESKGNDERKNVKFIDTITGSECFNKSQGIAKSHNSINCENDPLNVEDIMQEKENNDDAKDLPI